MADEAKTKTRQKAEKKGRRAETLAVLYLRLKGYKIWARRYKTKAGEIDVIARRKNILAMVEVKRRKDMVRAHESLHPQMLKRIEAATHIYCSRHPKTANLDVRFDVICVLPGFRIRHLRDAWRTY